MVDVYDKLLRTEYARLPEPVRRAYLSPPVLSLLVRPTANAFCLVDPAAADFPAPTALMPKLGIKSWRDSGSLGVIYEGVSIGVMLGLLLNAPTRPQLLAARAWLRTETPLSVHLAHYVDFSHVSEVRFFVQRQRCRWISTCLRGSTATLVDALNTQLVENAMQIAASLEDEPYILDLCVMSGGTIRVVDINPGLSPKELATIRDQ